MVKKLVYKLSVIFITVLLTVSCFAALPQKAEASVLDTLTNSVSSVSASVGSFFTNLFGAISNTLSGPTKLANVQTLPATNRNLVASVPASMYNDSSFNTPDITKVVTVQAPPKVVQEIRQINSGVSLEQLNYILADLESRLNLKISSIPIGSNGGGGGGIPPLTVLTDVITLEAESGSFNTLEVTGTATSTFAGGINITGGCLAIGGTCLGGSSTQWVTAGSDLYYTTGNVGVGTSSPYAKLSVEGNAVIGANILTSNLIATGTVTATSFIGDGSLLSGISGFSTTSAAYWITTKSTTNLPEGSNLYYTDTRFDNRLSATSSLPRLSTLAGLVSFGSSTATTTSLGNLSVSGNLNFTGSFLQNGTAFVGSQWTTAGSEIYYNSGNVGIGVADPTTALDVLGDITGSGALNITGTFSSDAGSITSDGSGNLTVTGDGDFGEIRTDLLSVGTAPFGVDIMNGNVTADGEVLGTTLTAVTSFNSDGASIFSDGSGNLNVFSISGDGSNLTGIATGLTVGNASTADFATNASNATQATAAYNADVATVALSAGTSGILYYGNGSALTDTNSLYHADGSALASGGALIAPTGFFVSGDSGFEPYSSGHILRSEGSPLYLKGTEVKFVNGDDIDILTISDQDNIGIGTTTPYAKLSVVGNVVARNFTATSTTATSTFAGPAGFGTTTTLSALAVQAQSGLACNGAPILGVYNTSGALAASLSYTCGTVGELFLKGSNNLTINPTALTTAGAFTITSFTPTIVASGNSAGLNIRPGAAGFDILQLKNSAGTVVSAFETTGKLGVGTTSPFSQLSVSTTTASSPTTSLFAVASSTHATLFNVLGSGNVGIGTTTPGARLSVTGAGATTGALFNLADSSNVSRFAVTDAGTITTRDTSLAGFVFTNSGSAAQILFQYNGGTRGSITGGTGSGNDIVMTSGSGGASGVSNGTISAAIYSNNNFGIGTTTPWGHLSVNPNAIGSGPAFVVGSSTATNFIVTNAGNVGIGMTTPTVPLHVTGNSTITGTVNGGAFTTAASYVTTASTGLLTNNSAVVINRNNSVIEVATNSFWTGVGLYAGGTERARVSSVGLGIGSSTPFAALSVSTTSSALPNMPLLTVASSTHASLFTVLGNGRVGIGTSSPASTLTVTGSACISGGAGSTEACSTTAGTITARVFNTASADLAERYAVQDTTIEAGDIVMLDTENSLTVKKAIKTQGNILGIISTQPGFLLGSTNLDNATTRPVALAGRVPVKFSTENGSVKIGDSLTLSSTTAGIAVKARTGDSLIGTALEDQSSNGTLIVFVRSGFTENLNTIANSQQESQNVSIIESLSSLLSGTTQWMYTQISAVSGYFKNIFAQNLTIGTAAKPAGITIYSQTGKPFCLTVADNGTPESIPGECTDAVNNPVAAPVTVPDPTVIPEATASTTPESTASSTPEVTEIEPEESVVEITESPVVAEPEPVSEPSPEPVPAPETTENNTQDTE